MPYDPTDLLLTGRERGALARLPLLGDVMEAELTGLGLQRNTCVPERLATDA